MRRWPDSVNKWKREMYKYLIYGVHIQSDIEIEEAVTDLSCENADITVTSEEMPEDIRNVLADRSPEERTSMTARDAFFFRVPDAAEYLVRRKQISVHILNRQNMLRVKTFLLGSAMGYAMYLDGRVLLHGSAVSKNGKGIIITGESGSGKSSVSGRLRDMGYLFISDDVCGIGEREGGAWISLAYPQLKLCRDAALRLGYDLDKLIYIDESRGKYAVRLKDGYERAGQVFNYMFEIVVTEEGSPEAEILLGQDKLMTVITNIFRGESGIKKWGLKPEYMKKIVDIASDIEVYRIRRPKGEDTLDRIVGIIDDKVNQ